MVSEKENDTTNMYEAISQSLWGRFKRLLFKKTWLSCDFVWHDEVRKELDDDELEEMNDMFMDLGIPTLVNNNEELESLTIREGLLYLPDVISINRSSMDGITTCVMRNGIYQMVDVPYETMQKYLL